MSPFSPVGGIKQKKLNLEQTPSQTGACLSYDGWRKRTLFSQFLERQPRTQTNVVYL